MKTERGDVRISITDGTKGNGGSKRKICESWSSGVVFFLSLSSSCLSVLQTSSLRLKTPNIYEDHLIYVLENIPGFSRITRE